MTRRESVMRANQEGVQQKEKKEEEIMEEVTGPQ
jgi:hypothetical protein